MKDFIVYQGSSFAIEWYFTDKGKSQSCEYFDDLDEDAQDSIMNLFKLMGIMGKIINKTKFRYEEDGIYAFKSKSNRFLCFFFTGKKIIITNAFEKKQDKLPPAEKKKALQYKLDYQIRTAQGNYYD